MPTPKHFLAEIEENILKIWADEQTFQKSLDNRKGQSEFTFYDGPPFANGLPHYGHVVQTTIKDSITRYKTMQGFLVKRRVGWDTHGLPIEYAIEKEHGFSGKQDIEKYGIEKFNQECKESVFKYKEIWEALFIRLGRWADYTQTYTTMDENYIESVWWVFKTIFEKGLVYKDFRSSPYCPRCATPLSNFELNQGYQDNVSDPSLYVKFKITDQDAYLLGWTTTPWSLPGNSAIAVNPDADYLYVTLQDDNHQDETLVLAKNRLACLNSDNYKIIRQVKGHDLVGLSYQPLFKLSNLKDEIYKDNLYKVWPADFVSIEDGSGVLHVAPAFGEDDLKLGQKFQLPILITLDEYGKIKTNLGLPDNIAGKFFKTADNLIIELLTKSNHVFAAETFKHTYPFCWRCDTPLLYYATDSWLVKVSQIVPRLIDNNQRINWTPNHIKDGRFGNWLENARDWSISRNRFWGSPLPIWQTDDGEETIIIGSLKELKERAVDGTKITDLHRPYIDQVKIKTDSGKIAKRIPEVFDCWFESGSMPYGQDHYPFNQDIDWQKVFPADFIAEAIDQTRGWFYTLHVLAVSLFDQPAFKNVISSGWVVAADGQKLSKRKKNYAPMDETFDNFGVDTLRFFMASSPIVHGEDVRFISNHLRDIQRKVFMTLNNSFNFYQLYADVDHFTPQHPGQIPKSHNLLDQWIIARLNQVIKKITTHLNNYRIDKASEQITDLLDDLSNWYIRRSRRRFWKSDNNLDKTEAYETLYYSLITICQLLAPFSPFLSDHIWRQLTNKTSLPTSVHLSDWPSTQKIDQTLLDNMTQTRDYINQGLAIRASQKIKVRQPLTSFTVPKLPDYYKSLIADELNVKEVKWGNEIDLDIKLNDQLIEEGLARELIRHIQNARKQANYQVDDRIQLTITSNQQIVQQTVEHQKNLIMEETLTTKLNQTIKQPDLTTDIKFDSYECQLRLKK